jgi:hypothetical protein
MGRRSGLSFSCANSYRRSARLKPANRCSANPQIELYACVSRKKLRNICVWLKNKMLFAPRGLRGLFAIVLAGTAAGVLDITAAFVTSASHGYSPLKVLQSIASGALGPRSFEGGWWTGALGAAFHFLIAFLAAAIFYAASRKIGLMRQRPIVSGVLYGIAVYLFMYWVVVPLSAIGWQTYSVSSTIRAILTHIVCVGLPISLVVQRCSIRPTAHFDHNESPTIPQAGP